MRNHPPAERTFKLLVFDLDGTLVDSAPDIVDSLNILRARYGLGPLGRRIVVNAIGKGLGNLMRKTLPPAVRRANRHHAEDYRRLYHGRIARRTRLYPGVARTLAKIRGARLTLASNKPQKLTLALLRELGIRKRFSAVICADRVKRPKPDPEVIHTLMRRFRARPDETLIVGDSKYDMEAGVRAGAATCAVRYGYGTRKEIARYRPDYVIKRFSSLLGILRAP